MPDQEKAEKEAREAAERAITDASLAHAQASLEQAIERVKDKDATEQLKGALETVTAVRAS